MNSEKNIIEFTEREYIEFFCWLLNKKEVKLEKEYDISLSLEKNEPYIYYTPEIKAFFETPAMKRLGKIGQIPNVNLTNSSAFQDRLEHCKGAYQKILDFYILQYKKSDWKESNNDEESRLKILADIMDMASHDIGHNIGSHALESFIGSQYGAHEILGNRILHENPDVVIAFSKIHPRLLEVLDVVKKQTYNLHTLKEGNIDFDRADFLSRDSLYCGVENGYDDSTNTDSIPVLLNSIMNGCQIIPIQNGGKNFECPVYSYKVVPQIESFLERRSQNYHNIYISKNTRPNDSILEEFCKTFLLSDEKAGKDLKDFLLHLASKTIDEIDLDLFVSWNGIRFYNSIFDIVENAEDDNIREFASLCLPTVEGMISIVQDKILPDIDPDIDENGNEINTENKLESEDRKFYLKVKEIVDTQDPRYYKNRIGEACLGVNFSSSEEMEKFLQELRLKYDLDENSISSLIPWKFKVKTYNPKEPIFILGEDKKIYTFDEYPNRRLNIDLQESCIVFGIMPKLKYDGASSESIEKIKMAFSNISKGQKIDFYYKQDDTRLISELMEMKYNRLEGR